MQNATLKTSATNNNDHEVLLELNRNYVRSAQESDVRWYAENVSEEKSKYRHKFNGLKNKSHLYLQTHTQRHAD